MLCVSLEALSEVLLMCTHVFVVGYEKYQSFLAKKEPHLQIKSDFMTLSTSEDPDQPEYQRKLTNKC